MRYTKFIIKNYKGITEVAIDLEKQPYSKVITLIGLNESGKTTILEAINLFENDIPETENHTLIPKNKKLNFNEVISLEAQLNLDVNDVFAIKKFGYSLGYKEFEIDENIIIIKEKKYKNSVFTKDFSKVKWNLEIACRRKGEKKLWKMYNMEDKDKIINFIEQNLLPPIIYYPNFLFDFPAKIYLEKTLNESEEQETYREVINDILESIDISLNFEDHILTRMKLSTTDAKEALASTINRLGSKITKTVFDAWETLFESGGKEIIVKEGKDDDSNHNCFLEVRLKEKSDEYQIAERSLGFKWFFTFLLFTEFRKVRSTDKGEILFLLDEPASNLHSTAQKQLLSTFGKLVDKCKLIYTTHSHHLINPDWLSGAYIIRNKNLNYEDELNYDSDMTDIEATPYKNFVAKHPNQRSYFQPILDALDYQPGLLENIEDIIITEGKIDYYTYRYINEIIMNNEFDGLHFYPGTGADGNYQVIALYLAWNRNFKIILDSNGGGKKAKEKYIKTFGEIIKQDIICLNDVDNKLDNRTIETLFNDTEKLRIINEFDDEGKVFHKSKFATAIQMLFIEKKSIQLSKETLNRFRKIYTVLNKKDIVLSVT